MAEFLLPDVGEGLLEAEILTWHVAVGDHVQVNDTLVEIETAKSVVELPSPFAGEVTALLVEEGTTVPVGTPIIAIGAPVAAEVEAEVAKPAREPVLVGYGPRDETTVRRRRRSGGTSATETVVSSVADVPHRVLAKPPVRKLAKVLGVDLARVPHDGPAVTRLDVERFATPIAAPTSTTAAGATRIPVKGVRKATAEAMVKSATEAPHASMWVTVDVSRTVEFKERHGISPTVIIAKAVCLALSRNPGLNASWAGDEIVLHPHVNLGIAAATERGLVVPVIERADTLSLADLGAAIGDLVETARAGRTQPAQLAGGTFSITNVGVFGVDGGTPILVPGQSGILAVGQFDRRPWVDENDQIVPRWVATLSVSIDHRVVDGEQGARFLRDVADLLQDPAVALTY